MSKILPYRILPNMNAPNRTLPDKLTTTQVAAAHVGAILGSIQESEIVVDRDRWLSMCCKLHLRVPCNGGFSGCFGGRTGTHPAIRALYTATGVHRCLVEDGAKVIDLQLAMAAMSTSDFGCGPLGSAGMRWTSRFASSQVSGVRSFGAGYCYQFLIVPAARMRVARVLGPVPLMVDFLRVYCVVGMPMVEPMELVKTADLCFHLQLSGASKFRLKESSLGIIWRMLYEVLASGAMARIGASGSENRLLPLAPVDLPIGYASNDASFLLGDLDGKFDGQNVSPVSSPAQSVEDVADIASFLLGNDVRKHSVTGQVVKVVCPDCKFLVNPVRHEERCNVAGNMRKKGQTWNRQRVKAWVNDTILKYDVQCLILRTTISTDKYQDTLNSFTSASAQAKYWMGLVDKSDLPAPSGHSEHSISTAFEAAYEGSFRNAYLEHVKEVLKL